MSLQNSSYDEIDDVIAMVNNGFERRRQEQIKREAEFEEKREKEVTAAVSMIERALERSIKEEEWIVKQEKISNEIESEYRKKMKNTILAVLISACLVSPFAIKAGRTIIDKINHWSNVNSAVSIQRGQIMDILLSGGFAYIDDGKNYVSEERVGQKSPFTVNDNSIEKYKNLDVDNYIDVYLYRSILPPEEFEDFIRSVSYVDTNGTVCYYLNFEQFLRINGFPDERTFINYAQEGAYQRQVQKEQDNQISAGYENTGKGGRS